MSIPLINDLSLLINKHCICPSKPFVNNTRAHLCTEQTDTEPWVTAIFYLVIFEIGKVCGGVCGGNYSFGSTYHITCMSSCVKHKMLMI